MLLFLLNEPIILESCCVSVSSSTQNQKKGGRKRFTIYGNGVVSENQVQEFQQVSFIDWKLQMNTRATTITKEYLNITVFTSGVYIYLIPNYNYNFTNYMVRYKLINKTWKWIVTVDPISTESD